MSLRNVRCEGMTGFIRFCKHDNGTLDPIKGLQFSIGRISLTSSRKLRLKNIPHFPQTCEDMRSPPIRAQRVELTRNVRSKRSNETCDWGQIVNCRKSSQAKIYNENGRYWQTRTSFLSHAHTLLRRLCLIGPVGSVNTGQAYVDTRLFA